MVVEEFVPFGDGEKRNEDLAAFACSKQVKSLGLNQSFICFKSRSVFFY